jgi:DNA-binding SARP family transcriptional activator
VAPDHRLTVSVLGPLEVRRDGVLVDHPLLSRERVRQLLQYLVFRSPVTRASVASDLWPDLEMEAATGNLRTTLSYLQKVLEPEREGKAKPWFLRTDVTVLNLHQGEELTVDARSFESALAAAQKAEMLAAPSLALKQLQEAIALYRGEALTELVGVDWADLERDRLRMKFVTAAVRCGELLLATGDSKAPLDLALRALRSDPWSEAAYALLAVCHLERGELDAARHTHRRCLVMLADMGLPAGPAMQTIARRLQSAGTPTPSRPRGKPPDSDTARRPEGAGYGQR